MEEVHLTPFLAGRIAAEARCKKLLLTHLYPECNQVDILQGCRRRYAGEIIVSEDLMRIRISIEAAAYSMPRASCFMVWLAGCAGVCALREAAATRENAKATLRFIAPLSRGGWMRLCLNLLFLSARLLLSDSERAALSIARRRSSWKKEDKTWIPKFGLFLSDYCFPMQSFRL